MHLHTRSIKAENPGISATVVVHGQRTVKVVINVTEGAVAQGWLQTRALEFSSHHGLTCRRKQEME